MKYTILLFSILLSTQILAADYYWIGGSGNWSDIDHWVTESGGNVNHAQVPTSNDNVIFDRNSFSGNNQTLTLNTDIVFFRDMDWTDVNETVTFRGGESVIINSFGSINLSTSIIFDFDGLITLNGNKIGNILNFGNNKAGNEIYFAGSGEWQFNSNIEVDSIFQLMEGNIITNGYNIRCRYLNIQSNNQKSFNCTNSEIEVWGSFGDYIYGGEDLDTITCKINTSNLVFESTGSTFLFTAPIVEVWFLGDATIQFNDVYYNNPVGRNRIRPWQGSAAINYNTLSLQGSSRLEGIHNAQRLELARNKIYRLQDEITYRMNEIVANATCSEGIIITSLNAGSEATIQSNSDILLNYITLRDIHATGASFTAQNSTNLGNNNNWVFTNSESIDYYWIGGSGNWTDPNHWSLTSGGPASGCVPSGKDDAYFDQNSFTGSNQSVTANIEDIFIHDVIWMDVTGNPELTGDEDFAFHITGSLRMDENMGHTFGGYYYFESAEMGNTIEMNGQLFNREVEFSGRNSDWTLLDDIYVHWNLTHKSGSLNTGGNDLNIFKYESFQTNIRSLDIRNSYILLRDVADQYGNAVFRPEWYVENENFTLAADNSTIEFQSVHYGGFRNNGPNILDYNKLIFSGYGGQINGYSNTGDISARIDSCIFHQRGSFYYNQEFNYLYLSPGFDYEFGPYSTYTIRELDANGDCENGLISLYCSDRQRQANFVVDDNHTLNRLSILDINNQGSGNMIANSSLDLGNNVGWTFTELTQRELYWVGNTGAWEDPAHWSLTSGGPGGECIPTAIDDVFFDENSFSEINQSVYSDNNRFLVCHSMFWDNAFGNPNFGYFYESDTAYFSTDRIKLYGSLDLDSEMNVNTYWFHFATTELDSVNSHGNFMGGLILEGLGEVLIQDDLNCSYIGHKSGSVDYLSVTVNLFSYDCYNVNDRPMSTKMNESVFNFGSGGSNTYYSDQAINHQFDSDKSIFYFHASNSYFTTSRGNKYNKILSTNPGGTLYIGDRRPEWNKPDDAKQYEAKYLRFAGNGYMLGEISTDTLIGSPGKSYTMESAEVQSVNRYLQLIGNNCTPIELKATEFGTQANINMPSSAEMLVNFVEMRDNNGIGGAEFIAGSRSTDIGMSNTGWFFDDPPEFVETGFLGIDRALCLTSEITLNAYNYSPNESYEWSTGSMDTIINITSSGIYGVTVTFGSGCEINDEIILLEPDDLKLNLPNDTIICEGSALAVDGNVGLQATDYLWLDAFDRSKRDITEAGFYKLTATKDGCEISDSFTVNLQEIPIISLGQDTILCFNDSIELEVSFPSAEYLWYDNTLDPNHIFTLPGTFWVESSLNGCQYRDSININYIDEFHVELGNDTIICADENIELNGEVTINNINYLWNTGVVGSLLSVTAEGTYILEASIDQCFSSDTIIVVVQETPIVDLGEDKTLCFLDTITLKAEFEGASFAWQDMQVGPRYFIDSPGTYWVESRKNNCSYRDSIIIEYVEDFIPMLGSDTTICSNESIELSPGSFADASFTWSDGGNAQSNVVADPGIYFVDVEIKGCVESDTINLQVQIAPDLELGEDVFACVGDTIKLESNINADSYNWTTGNNTSSIEVEVDGRYRLDIIDNFCLVSDSLSVVFSTYPLIELGRDTSICRGESLLFIIDQLGTWQDGSLDNSFQATTAGIYTVAVNNQGCISRDSIQLIVKDLPQFDLGMDRSACVGDVQNIEAPLSFSAFIWDNGSTEPIRTFLSSTSIWIEVEDDGCKRRDSLDINFKELPFIELGLDTTICSDANYEIVPAKSEGMISWPDGSNGESYLVPNPGLILAEIENNGCVSRDSVLISFRECVYFQSYIPNAFSPNRDGNNDAFKPQFEPGINILDYSLNIYDRWGNQVFSTRDLDAEWDGNYTNKLGRDGVYVYFVNIVYEDDNGRSERNITGDILLIR